MKNLKFIFLTVTMGLILGSISGINPLIITGGLAGGVCLVKRYSILPNGITLMSFTDLLWSSGSENLGSIKGHILYCPIDDIKLPLPSLTGVGKLDITDTLACKQGKQFFSIYHTAETGKHDGGTVGDRDGKSSENILDFNYPGSTQAAAEFARKIINTPCVVIYTDGSSKRVMGLHNPDINTTELTLDIPAYFEQASYTSGTKYADKKGTAFQIKQGGHPALYYKGDIASLLVPAA